MTLNRYYVAKVTLPEERTFHLSMSSLLQILGSVVGPGFSSVLSSIGEKESVLEQSHIYFDMYTVTG